MLRRYLAQFLVFLLFLLPVSSILLPETVHADAACDKAKAAATREASSATAVVKQLDIVYQTAHTNVVSNSIDRLPSNKSSSGYKQQDVKDVVLDELNQNRQTIEAFATSNLKTRLSAYQAAVLNIKDSCSADEYIGYVQVYNSLASEYNDTWLQSKKQFPYPAKVDSMKQQITENIASVYLRLNIIPFYSGTAAVNEAFSDFGTPELTLPKAKLLDATVDQTQLDCEKIINQLETEVTVANGKIKDAETTSYDTFQGATQQDKITATKNAIALAETEMNKADTLVSQGVDQGCHQGTASTADRFKQAAHAFKDLRGRLNAVRTKVGEAEKSWSNKASSIIDSGIKTVENIFAGCKEIQSAIQTSNPIYSEIYKGVACFLSSIVDGLVKFLEQQLAFAQQVLKAS